jgi:hypothetical protein
MSFLFPKTNQLNSHGIFDNTLNLLSTIFDTAIVGILRILRIFSSLKSIIGVTFTVRSFARYLT